MAYQNYMKKKVIENFEPELYFYNMGQKSQYTGFKTISWTRIARLTTSVANSTLLPGVTPADQNLVETTVTATPSQYGLYVTLTDELKAIASVDVVAQTIKLVGNNLARVIDQVVQSHLLTNGTTVIYGGTAPDRAGIDNTSDKMTWQTVAKATALLEVKAAKRFDYDSYVGIFHTNIIYDLLIETTTWSFIDVAKYAMPEKIMKGEIGMIANCRILKTPFIQTVASWVTVYPSYIMWADAYGVGELMGLEATDTGWKATDSDPLAQRRKIWAKIHFGLAILRQESLVRVETGCSLDSSVYVFS